jgi:hypothetical protein
MPQEQLNIKTPKLLTVLFIPVPYGRKDQCIYSVGRRYVNEILLNGKKFQSLILKASTQLIEWHLNQSPSIFSLCLFQNKVSPKVIGFVINWNIKASQPLPPSSPNTDTRQPW